MDEEEVFNRVTEADMVKRICRERQADPAEVLGVILTAMGAFHHWRTMHRESTPAKDMNALDAITRTRDRLKSSTPVSIVAAADQAIQEMRAADVSNLGWMKSKGHPSPETEKRIRLADTARLILRDVMNNAERTGLVAAMTLDEMKSDREG